MSGRDQQLMRARLVLAVAVACLLGMLVLALLARTQSVERSSAAARSNLTSTGYAGSLLPDGFRTPDFALRDQDGKLVTETMLRGRPVFLTFTYSTCQDSCPVQVRLIRDAMQKLGPRARAFAISVDPANDTPMRATRFLAKQRVLGRVRYLLGTRRSLTPVWRGFGVQPQTRQQEHHARIVLADGRGFQRVGYSASEVTAAQLAADYRRLQRKGF